jgi:hypothetical protein
MWCTGIGATLHLPFATIPDKDMSVDFYGLFHQYLDMNQQSLNTFILLMKQ